VGIRLVVGLGNPGKEYERTRHNAGFWLVERYATASGVVLRKDAKFQALVGRLEGGPAAVWLLLPQTFMNASGRPVQMLASFFKIKPDEILVVHDELDFPPGVARLKQGGGIAGHNGLKDISQRLATHEYWRLRLGVGKPPAGREGADYVLERPSAEEKSAIDAVTDKALSLMPQMLAGDMQSAMNKLHTEDKPAAAEQKPAAEKIADASTPVTAASAKREAQKPAAAAAKAQADKAPAEKKGLFGGLLGRKK